MYTSLVLFSPGVSNLFGSLSIILSIYCRNLRKSFLWELRHWLNFWNRLLLMLIRLDSLSGNFFWHSLKILDIHVMLCRLLRNFFLNIHGHGHLLDIRSFRGAWISSRLWSFRRFSRLGFLDHLDTASLLSNHFLRLNLLRVLGSLRNWVFRDVKSVVEVVDLV